MGGGSPILPVKEPDMETAPPALPMELAGLPPGAFDKADPLWAVVGTVA
jgi:hypothetical protein